MRPALAIDDQEENTRLYLGAARSADLLRRGGRPPIGSAAASVESARLDPNYATLWPGEPSATTKQPHR